MINLKGFIIFFIILTHFIYETKYLPHKRRFGVSGVLTCGTKYNGEPVIVSLSKKYNLHKKKPLEKILAKTGYQFHISAKALSRTSENFFLKIVHSCHYTSDTCKSVTLIEIPRNFVYKGTTLQQFYSIGTIDLKKQPSMPLLSTKKNQKCSLRRIGK